MTDGGAPLDFIVIGAQRSASTYLSACLGDHPGLYMCGDEVPYFEHPFFQSSPLSALEAVFAGAAPGQRTGIQRPDYLARPECPANIHSVAPDARLIALLRDPAQRAVSAYFWYVQFGLLPLEPLDVGMERLLDGWTHPDYPRAAEVIELGLYAEHLARYLDLFDPDQLLVLFDEDLAEDAALARVYGFLGVDPGHRPAAGRRRTNAGVYDLRRLRVLRARRRFAWSWDSVSVYEYRPRRLRRPVRSLVSAGVVALDRFVLARVLTSPRPHLRADLADRLRATYAADITRLEGLTGRDLSAWRAPGPQVEGSRATP